MNKLALFFVGFLFLSACSLLDQKSPNDLDADGLITSPEAAENALIGCYASLQSRDYYGAHFQLMADAGSDDVATGGYDVASLDELDANAATPSNVYVEATWIAIYRSIANCNRLLEGLAGIDDGVFEAGQKAQIEGEARFLRALAHHDLLRLFGEHFDQNSAFGIPIIDRTRAIDDAAARSSVLECNSFIINELEAARGLISTDFRGANFASVAAIDALLGRVFLYQNEKGKAAAAAEKVIGDATFSLGDAAKIYSERAGQESIFELAFDVRNKSAFNGTTYGKDAALRPELFFMAAENLKTFFEGRPNDSRAALLDFENCDESIKPDGRTQKYRGEATKDNPAYILRLAEQFLIKSEAEGWPNGVASLNILRSKRELGDLDSAISEADFQTALDDERRAELNFEGHRFFDLARRGTFSAVTGADVSKQIWPIPQREITASAGKVAQNRGY